MNGTYPRLAHDQDRAGRIVLMASSALAAFLVLAGLIYATGNSARSAAALAAAGCEPGLSSDSAPCTTRQDLISEYTAAVTPAGRQLDIDAAAYTASEGHHLAQAEAALMSEAAVEHEFAARLAAIKFPPSIAPTAATLIRTSQAYAKLVTAQAQAPSLSRMRSFDRRAQAAGAAVQAEMKLMRKALDSPPATA